MEPPTVLKRTPRSDTPDHPHSPPPSPTIIETVRAGESATPARSCSNDDDETQGRDGAESKTRWRDGWEKWNPQLTLENAGSVARDHLASERTFLAYVRTSLTIASTGVALVQLFTLAAMSSAHARVERYARPLGALTIVVALCVLGLGVVRYFLVQGALVRGVYPVARVSTVFVALTMLGIILATFVIILVAR